MPEDIIRRPTEAPPARRPDVTTQQAAPILDVKPTPAEAAETTSVAKGAMPQAVETTPAEADTEQSATATAKGAKSSRPIGVIIVAVLVSAALIGLTVYLGMNG